jgi:hypothetical protein
MCWSARHRIMANAAIGREMAALPDLAAAALYGVVVFLLALGFLVIFVETVPPRRLIALLLGSFLVAVVLAGMGETGIAFLALGVGAALVANHAFEWLTTR